MHSFFFPIEFFLIYTHFRIMDPKPESPCTISSKIIDQTKKSGEFDKYRHELANNIIESSEMQKLIEKCNGIIEEELRSASDADLQKFGISKIREAVKGEIKKRKLIDNMMNHVLNQHMQRIHPILSVRIEEMVRAELGIPKEIKPAAAELLDANLESIDMEVSSGASSDPSTASNTPRMNSPRSSGSKSKRKFNSPPGNCSAASTSPSSNHHIGRRKGSMISVKSHDDHHLKKFANNKIDVEFDDEEDASALLDKFADSISSACSSSLSCNASEDGQRLAELDQKSTSSSSSSSNKSSSSAHSSTANRESSSKKNIS